MKTLKTIFILLSLVCANSSFAQTQEETIAWIREKLEKHGVSDGEKNSVVIINLTPCEIYYKRIFDGEDWDTFKFNPSESEWSINEKSKEIVSKRGKIIESYAFYRSQKSYLNWLPLSEKNVPDIIERFTKALNHLGTFCEKKKETF